jgi:hypothetical protein
MTPMSRPISDLQLPLTLRTVIAGQDEKVAVDEPSGSAAVGSSRFVPLIEAFSLFA